MPDAHAATFSYRCSIDLDAPGRAIGHVAIPWSRDESGWGNLLTPIAVLGDGDGPTVLLTGGNHGDEFEGPIALRSLLQDLDPSEVHGRIIVVPGLNQAALKVGRRLSPIDGGNLNRLFPGDPAGTPTQRIADFVTRELVARAHLVVDVHSGGNSMVFQPMVITHQLDNPAQAAATAEYLKVFGVPFALVADEPDPAGMLDNTVEAMGKVFITTEIWGGRAVSALSIGIARRGILNVLRQAGVLDGEPEYDAPPAFLRMVSDGSVIAPRSGLFQPLADPGDEVVRHDVVAHIHTLDDLAAPPTALRTDVEGVVIMRHNPGLIETGDPAVTVAVHEPAPW